MKGLTALLLCAQIVNIEGRTTYSLDGWWQYELDPQMAAYTGYRNLPPAKTPSAFRDEDPGPETVRNYSVNFAAADSLRVPGDWNTQRRELLLYEGAVWYRKRFDFHPDPRKRYFLYFGAANYAAVAGLNGERLGRHEGGYTPFNFEVTGRLRDGRNSAVVLVSNRHSDATVPATTFDWWNYGGLTRSVCLVETPATFIRDYYVHLDRQEVPQPRRRGPAERTITGWVQLDGPEAAQEVTVSIPALKAAVRVRTDPSGYAAFAFKARPELWSPAHPRRYEVVLSSVSDCIRDTIGFRTIRVEGKRLLLNGKDLFLKGINLHGEYADGDASRVLATPGQAARMLDLAAALGCNFIRGAHYPHPEALVREADRRGLLYWGEIPVYWSVDFQDPDTYACALSQLRELVTRDKNRANVIIWSVGNENLRTLPGRDAFLSALIQEARRADPERLVTLAMEYDTPRDGQGTCTDPLRFEADLMSFNEYSYAKGDQARCRETRWTFDVDKPVVISEFGCHAPTGKHGAATEAYTQERMDDLYRSKLEMYAHIDGLAGVVPWQLTDTRSPRRFCSGVGDGYSRAGLVDTDGRRKGAWSIVRDWFSGR